MKRVLITGANGQLGQCIRKISINDNELYFVFLNSKELDVTDHKSVEFFFEKNKYDFCVNCAAYTAVDKAETEIELARKVNFLGAQYIAEACSKNNVKLIHISTDFVFDGRNYIPYKENDVTNPVSVYGKTKLEGEKAIQAILKEYFIIRTSWLYSEYAANFMKTMLRLGNERNELGIVSDQIGTPTYAIDLAKVIVKIIKDDSGKYGLYHYSNEGVASWYDFSKAIFDLTNSEININALPTSAYPTLAERPRYSVMDKSKIMKNLDVKVPYWRDSLKIALSNLELVHK